MNRRQRNSPESRLLKRQPTAEWLDAEAGRPAEIVASFRDLRFINRYFGGDVATRAMIERVAAASQITSLSLLEVAAGSGDGPLAVRRSLKRRGLHLDVTLLDRAASHLLTPDRRNGTPTVIGDALALPFRDESFDLVGCTLFAHHLSPLQLGQFVHEGLRVCKKAVLINDLVRDIRHLALSYAALPLFRSRLTRHDAIASVRQAYTQEEMAVLLRPTKGARVEIHRRYLFRMAVVIWKQVGS